MPTDGDRQRQGRVLREPRRTASSRGTAAARARSGNRIRRGGLQGALGAPGDSQQHRVPGERECGVQQQLRRPAAQGGLAPLGGGGGSSGGSRPFISRFMARYATIVHASSSAEAGRSCGPRRSRAICVKSLTSSLMSIGTSALLRIMRGRPIVQVIVALRLQPIITTSAALAELATRSARAAAHRTRHRVSARAHLPRAAVSRATVLGGRVGLHRSAGA